MLIDNLYYYKHFNILLCLQVTKFSSGDFNVINGVLQTAASIFEKYTFEMKSQTLWWEQIISTILLRNSPYTETPSSLTYLVDRFLMENLIQGVLPYWLSLYRDCRYKDSQYGKTPWIKLHSVRSLYTDVLSFCPSPLFCPYTETPHLVHTLLPDVIESPYTDTQEYISYLMIIQKQNECYVLPFKFNF